LLGWKGEVPLLIMQQMWLQHDSAQPQFDRQVTEDSDLFNLIIGALKKVHQFLILKVKI
jgi:hypothetical protein